LVRDAADLLVRRSGAQALRDGVDLPLPCLVSRYPPTPRSERGGGHHVSHDDRRPESAPPAGSPALCDATPTDRARQSEALSGPERGATGERPAAAVVW